MWYAVPAGTGQEYPSRTPFGAHLKLEQLDVQGNIELVTAAGRRDIVACRAADGTWYGPDDIPHN
jgi:hypothetical protein